MRETPSLKLVKMSLICSVLSLTLIGQILALIGFFKWYPNGSNGRKLSFVAIIFAMLASIFYYAIFPDAANFIFNTFIRWSLSIYDNEDAIVSFIDNL